MTAPNRVALERLSAFWQLVSTHPELPVFESVSYTRSAGRITVTVADPTAVDLYADALGLPPTKMWQSLGQWHYIRQSAIYAIGAFELPDPVAQQGVETAENTALAGA